MPSFDDIPKTIFVACLVDRGRPGALKAFLARFFLQQRLPNNGQFAIVGNELLHLCGWTNSQDLAEEMGQALRDDDLEQADGRPTEIRMLNAWPTDVSGWPSAEFQGVKGVMNLPPDTLEELRANP